MFVLSLSLFLFLSVSLSLVAILSLTCLGFALAFYYIILYFFNCCRLSVWLLTVLFTLSPNGSVCVKAFSDQPALLYADRWLLSFPIFAS